MRLLCVAAAAGLISIVGCAPSIKITSDFQDPGFSFGQIPQQSSIKVIVSETVNLMAFKNSYYKEYQSDQEFSGILQKQIADSIKAIIGCSANASGNSQEASLLNSGSYDQPSIDQMQQLFGSSSEKYFLLVKSVDISNRRTSNAPMMMASPGGGSTFVGGGSSETCIVTINAELWEVQGKKKVLSYSSIGEAQVAMMFYGTALKNAVSNSIKYMVRYLMTGVTT